MEKIYLISGSETYDKNELLEKIKMEFGPLENGINYIVLDKNQIDSLELEINTVPFGYAKKMIVVKYDVPTEKEEDSKENSSIDMLVQQLEHLNDSVCIVLFGNFSAKSKLYKFVEKNGKCFVLEHKKENELVTWCRELFQKNEINIDSSTISYFIEVCGTEKQILKNEIDKLSSYALNIKVIKKADIDQLCVKSAEVIIFDLTDSLGTKNLKKALSSLHDLIENKEPLPKIIIMIAKHFKSLLISKVAIKQGKNVLNELETKSSYAANKYQSQSRLFSEKELIDKLGKLAKLDVDSKIGKIDLQLGLEKWICES